LVKRPKFRSAARARSLRALTETNTDKPFHGQNGDLTSREITGAESGNDGLSYSICVIVLCDNLDLELGRIFDVVGTSVMFELTLLAADTLNFENAHMRDLFFL
jgi:hypothetical protein